MITRTKTVSNIQTLGCPRKLGSKVRISGLSTQYTPFISRWNNPLILTIDPNFLGHPNPNTPNFQPCPGHQHVTCIFQFLLGCLMFCLRIQRNQGGENSTYTPGDSIRDLFIPDRWRSPTTFEEVTFSLTIPKRSPSQNCQVYVGCGPLTVTVTTRIITFLVGHPYKPTFPTGILWGGKKTQGIEVLFPLIFWWGSMSKAYLEDHSS